MVSGEPSGLIIFNAASPFLVSVPSRLYPLRRATGGSQARWEAVPAWPLDGLGRAKVHVGGFDWEGNWLPRLWASAGGSTRLLRCSNQSPLPPAAE